MQHVWAGVQIPARVDVLVSNDGKDFTKVSTIKHEPDGKGEHIQMLSAPLKNVRGRFVKIVAYTNGQWLFIDETVVNPIIASR